MDQTQRRGRPPKRDRAAEIVDAGLAEFAVHGFAATRLEDVARRAGIAKGTIYLYFADKEALFLAAVRSRIAPFFDEVSRFVDAYPGSSLELVEHVVRELHQRLLTSDLPVLMRIIIAEGAKFPQLTEHYYAESVAKGRALLQRIVARGVGRGEIRPGAVSDLPEVIIAPAIMASVWRMTFQPIAPIEPDRFLAAHLDLVLTALAAPSGPPAPDRNPA